MPNRFIVFDVETPNSQNHRMSAIGITVVENGEITDNFYSLVNPETHFDWFNTTLTGITPEMVKNEPTFPELWEKIAPLMESGILAAHNAPFDMSVLAKCLNFYGLPKAPVAHYICTCRMGKKCYPELPDHKLNTMCDFLHLDLDHHNASSDSTAAAMLLINYLENGISVNTFLRAYDLEKGLTLKQKVTL